MKFVLASYGGRGDIEPAVVVGRELLRRGHDVRMAVPPNLVGFTEAAGLAAVAYGLDSKPIMDLQRKYWTCYFRTPWKLKELNRMGRETAEFATQCWGEMTTALASAAAGADLLLTGLIFEQPAANVAEYHDIPLATLHFFPVRAHGRLLPFLPAPLSRAVMMVNDWLVWRGTKKDEDAQRRELGLPKATSPSAAADRRTRIAGNPGLRRGVLSRTGFRMGEMGLANDRLSARWRWRCRRMPMRRSRRGLPREHRRFASGLAAYRSILRPTRSP